MRLRTVTGDYMQNKSEKVSFFYNNNTLNNYPKTPRSSMTFQKIKILIVVMLYVLLHEITAIESIKIALGVIFVAFLTFYDIDDAFFSLMFIMCGNEVLDVGSTSIAMIFVAIYSLKKIYVQFVCGYKYRISVPILLSCVSLIIISLVEIANESSGQLLNFIKCIFFLFFMCNILEKHRNNLLWLFSTAFRYIAFGINYFGIVSLLSQGVPSLSVRFTISPEVTINYLAIICAISIVNLVYNIFVLEGKKIFVDIILICGCFIWGLLTQSRSFLLAVAIGIFLIFLLSSSFERKIKILLGITFLVLIVLFVNYLYATPLSDMISNVLNRLSDPSGGDISNGRYDLWKATIDNMNADTRKMLFGAGDYTRIDVTMRDRSIVAHNMFLETWVVFGYIGCALLIVLFYSYIKMFVFKGGFTTNKVVSFVPLIVMGCALFYSHHFIGRGMSLVFILNFIPLAQKSEKRCVN